MAWADIKALWTVPQETIELEKLRAENLDLRERLAMSERLLHGKWAPAREVPEEILRHAHKLVFSINGDPASGEAKRHQVFAKMIKEFPGVRKRVLGLAIEMAMDERVK